MSIHRGFVSWPGAALIGVALLAASACGGDDDAPSPTAVPNIPTDPDALGALIIADYRAMLEELFVIINGLPPAADIVSEVAALKARYIERFVGHGYIREDMSTQDRAIVSSAAVRELSALPANFQKPLIDANAYYNGISDDPSRALASELASVSVLTQYAFFELLKQQLPAEAERLGID